MKKKQFIRYSDPGHGWLRVSIKDLIKLCLSLEISEYSYIHNGYAYLEEDCDMSKFIDAYGADNMVIREKFANYESKIREYNRYTPAVLYRSIFKKRS